MKTRIINLQFAFFFKDTVERPDLKFNNLNDEMLNVFDAIPQIVPIPREIPVDIPIIMLRSSSGEYSCNISRNRIDFFFNRINGEKTNTFILNDFNVKVKGLISSIIPKQEINRFGMVARYFHNDNAAIHTVRKKFFSNIVEGARELGLRFNKPSDFNHLRINDIIEVNVGEMNIDNTLLKGILIQRDINNNANKSSIIDSTLLSEISAKYSSKFSEVEIERLIK